jgi:hypothetical protein
MLLLKDLIDKGDCRKKKYPVVGFWKRAKGDLRGWMITCIW